jgi:hypothetical protein
VVPFAPHLRKPDVRQRRLPFSAARREEFPSPQIREVDAMPNETNEEVPTQPSEAPGSTNRREFLGKTAVMAAAAVGAPALLAACDSEATTPAEATPAAAAAGPSNAYAPTECRQHVSPQPWWAVHYTLAGTIGANTYVKIPTLEKGTYGYVQRVITDDSRIGSALSTVLQKTWKWSTGSLSVIVQNSRGTAWSRRSISSNSDLAYAMKDALAGNTLGYGVLRDSLTKGKPVVAVVKSAIVQYYDSVASDYYGNMNKPAHSAFSGVFNAGVSDIAITTIIRDISRS